MCFVRCTEVVAMTLTSVMMMDRVRPHTEALKGKIKDDSIKYPIQLLNYSHPRSLGFVSVLTKVVLTV